MKDRQSRKLCKHFKHGRCKNQVEEVRHKGGSYFRMAVCSNQCQDYEEDPEKLLKHFKCPNCIYFHAIYAVWGSETYCNRMGDFEPQDWQKEHCKFFTPKTDKK